MTDLVAILLAAGTFGFACSYVSGYFAYQKGYSDALAEASNILADSIKERLEGLFDNETD